MYDRLLRSARLAPLAAVIALHGCALVVSPGTGDSDAASSDGSTSFTAQPPTDACEQPASPRLVPTTVAQFRPLITARWLLCGTESVFGRGQGDVGLSG